MKTGGDSSQSQEQVQVRRYVELGSNESWLKSEHATAIIPLGINVLEARGADKNVKPTARQPVSCFTCVSCCRLVVLVVWWRSHKYVHIYDGLFLLSAGLDLESPRRHISRVCVYVHRFSLRDPKGKLRVDAIKLHCTLVLNC